MTVLGAGCWSRIASSKITLPPTTTLWSPLVNPALLSLSCFLTPTNLSHSACVLKLHNYVCTRRCAQHVIPTGYSYFILSHRC